MLLAASHQIIQSTLYFATAFHVPTFFIGLFVIALGTNIPEMSIVIRSLFQRRTDIALADYLGSAVANTFLIGTLSLIHGKTILLPNHFLHRFIFLITGLILFFLFARSKNTLSRYESLTLFGCYILFLVVELVIFPVNY